MADKQYRMLLVSDFNTGVLSSCLDSVEGQMTFDVKTADFGQVIPVLRQNNLECWKVKYDAVMIWTQPEAVIKTYDNVVNYEKVSLDEILEEVDCFADYILGIRDRTRFVFVPSWSEPSYHKVFGMFDMKSKIGRSDILMRMNINLSERLDAASNVICLNSRKWIEAGGANAFNPKLLYLGKVPFSNQVFFEASKDIQYALSGLAGEAKKMIVLDLDDTLWGGIVGEVGWENIRLGGHDHVGEAFVDFQKSLKNMTKRGVILGIASKNQEDVALEAIKNHPEMVLSLEDFAGWKINWHDKAQNIVDLSLDLGIGLQSIVFIDDNPVERARVRDTLPEVLVPEWPRDKMLYKKSLCSLGCFDVSSISDEDLSRSNMYVSERKRKNLKKRIGSLDEWFLSLDIRVRVELLNDINCQRAGQLLNKTNQMNTSNRRMSEQEFLKWAGEKNHKVWTFRVSDKYGDSGLTGIASVEVDEKLVRIVDFLLSCRVIGREIEIVMLSTVIKYADKIGADEVQVGFITSPKNQPCLDFWKRSGLKCLKENLLFSWNMVAEYPAPRYITIE